MGDLAGLRVLCLAESVLRRSELHDCLGRLRELRCLLLGGVRFDTARMVEVYGHSGSTPLAAVPGGHGHVAGNCPSDPAVCALACLYCGVATHTLAACFTKPDGWKPGMQRRFARAVQSAERYDDQTL